MSKSHSPNGNSPFFPTPSLYDQFRNSLARKLRRMARWSGGVRGRRPLQFETLEPRVLLSADLSYTATTTGDLTLRVADVGGNNTLQLLDTATSAVVASESLANIDGSSGYGARIDAGGFDVILRIDESIELAGVAGGVIFAGGDGVSSLVGAGRANFWEVAGVGSGEVGIVSFTGVENLFGGDDDDTLAGPQGDTIWDITGAGEGTVAGMHFSGVENLQGSSDNEDTFVIGEDGSISGVVDGGAGGFDTLVLDGGTFQSVIYTATGPHSGSIVRDGDVLQYDGLEPITDNANVVDRVVGTSSVDDLAFLTDNNDGTLTLVDTSSTPAFEQITFAKPSNSLTINLSSDSGTPLSVDVLTINSFNTPGIDLIVNGDGGRDVVNFIGAVNARNLTVNAEVISVTSAVTATADILLNAADSLGTVPAPDTNNTPLPLLASVIVDGGSLVANDITLTATTSLVSEVTTQVVGQPGVYGLIAGLISEVAVQGNAIVSATGTFTAQAFSNVDALVEGTPVLTGTDESALAAPSINTLTRSHLSGNATVSASGAVMISAATNLIVDAIADGALGVGIQGATVAAPLIATVTEAFIDGTADVTNSSSIDIRATTNSDITATSNSTPAGAILNPDTLADLQVATAAGPQTDAAAIAGITLGSLTRAFVTTTGTLVSSGEVSIFAGSDHDLFSMADATPTVAVDANGFAVAVNITTIQDDAFVGGAPTINATALNIETGNAPDLVAPTPGHQIKALARSGAAGIGDANLDIVAGAYAATTGINLSHAYIAQGTTLNLVGSPDVNINAANTTATDLSAEPQGAAVLATELGVGRSVAVNAASFTTQASIESGVNIIGARDLNLTANGVQTTLVTAYAGVLAADFGDISDMNQVTLAGSVAQNSSIAVIDVGAAMTLAGALTVAATNRGTNLIRARSDAAVLIGPIPDEAIATPIALNMANDVATATVAGNVSAAGAVEITATTDVENQAESIAGVKGADPSSTGAADLVAQEIAFLSDRSNIAFGSSPTPPATDPDIDPLNLAALLSNQTQGKAAALAVNLSNATANAEITNTANVTATNNTLNVDALSDIDSSALASASAVNHAFGVAAAIAANAQLSNTIASISGSATANEITILAETLDDLPNDGIHTLSAEAVSGAGGMAAGAAGAAAATQSQGTTNAFVGSGASLTLTNSGDLAVTANMDLENIANATPFVDALTTLGVGASFELNSSVFQTVADIQQNVVIQGADDLRVTATANYEAEAIAEAGVSAGSSIGAAIAALLNDNDTIANISNSAGLSQITGDLEVSAHQTSNAVHSANASVLAADAGVGAAVALGLMQGGAQAFLGNTIVVDGSVEVSAVTDSFMDADAVASSDGVESDDTLVEFKLDQIMDLAFQSIIPAFEIDPQADVNGGADQLTVTGHGLATGDSVLYTNGDDDETIGALEDGDTYFVHVIDPNTITLHLNRTDADNGTSAVNLAPTADVDNLHGLQRGLPVAIRDLIANGRMGTADGSLGAAAAIAANLDFNSALAGIIAGANVTADGSVTVTSEMDSDADAFATGQAVTSAITVGVAAAANISSQSNEAFIEGTVAASGIQVQALLGGDGVLNFTAEAISGGGTESNLGVAGAFALNFSAPLLPLNPITIPIPALPQIPQLPQLPAPPPPIPAPPPLPQIPQPSLPTLPTIPVPTGGQHLATIRNGADITLVGGTDLEVRSEFEAIYTATTSATPDTAGVGVGPSFSANAMSQVVKAEIQNATISGNQIILGNRTNIQVLASGDYTATANATAGATNAVNLPAAAALNYNDLETTAAAAGTATISGSLLVDADHHALTTHIANTDSGFGEVSIGPAIALGFVEGGAAASSAMDIQVGAGVQTVTVTADNVSFMDADAISGLDGSEGDFDGDPVGEQVEKQIEQLLALAGESEIPDEILAVLQRVSAETADGPIGVAAAIAGNLDYGFSKAALLSGGSTNSPTTPTVRATADMDVDTLADADNVTSGSGVSVAVAFNVDGQIVESAIGGDVTAPSLLLQALTDTDGANTFNATAISGSGSEDAGVAGAFAINISGNPLAVQDPLDLLTPSGGGQHNALILDGAHINLTANNDVTVQATYIGVYNAIATSDPGVGSLGFGPSVAINIIRHDTNAVIGADVTFTNVDDISVTADGTYTTTTLAEAGANNPGSVPAAIALTATLNNTTAAMASPSDPDTLATSFITGNVSAIANHTATTHTTADAVAGDAEVGIGAAIAAGGPQGGAIAQAGGKLSVDGSVTVTANTDSVAHTLALASVLGATSEGLTVDEETERQLARLAEISGLDKLLFPSIDPHPALAVSIDASKDVDADNDTIKVSTPHEFDTGDAVVYHNNQDDVNIGSLLDGNTYFVRVDSGDPSLLQLFASRENALSGTTPISLNPVTTPEDRHSFVAERTFDPGSALNTSDNTINVGSFAGLADGDAVKYFNGGGDNIGGLQDGQLYYVNINDGDPNNILIQLFDSRQRAMTSTAPINLDTGATGSTHRILKVVDAYRPLDVQTTVDPGTAVNSTLNTVNLSAFDGLKTGDAVIYRNGGNNNIGGLVDDTVYYVSVANDDLTQVQLLTTKDAADVVDLNASGLAGTQHQFERVAIDAVDPLAIPFIQIGAAAAIAIGAGRPVADASIGADSILNADGEVRITALMDFDSDATADATVSTVGAVGLAFAGNFSEGQHIAEIGSDATVSGDLVSLEAIGEGDEPYSFIAEAASVAAGLGGSVAGSIAVNAMHNYTAARIGNGATVDSDTFVDVLANLRRSGGAFLDAGRVESVTRAGEIALGGLVAAGAAIAGSFSLDGDAVEALIGSGTDITGGSDINVRAQGTQLFDSQAVGGSASLLASASLAGAFNISFSDFRANVGGGGSLTAISGDIIVLARSDSDYDAFALALTGSGLAAVGGAVAANLIFITVEASASGELDAGGDLLVSATDDSDVDADTGALAAVLGIVGVGAGAGVTISANVVQNVIRAELEDALVTDATTIQIDAISTADVNAFAFVGSGVASPGFLVGIAIGVTGSIALNSVHNIVEAQMVDSESLAGVVGEVSIEALDDNDVNADAGSFAFALTAAPILGAGIAIAAAVAVNDVQNRIKAAILGSTVRTTGDVDLDATTQGDIDAFALGLAGAASAGGIAGISVAGAGSAAGNNVATTVEALIGADSLIFPDGNVELLAKDMLDIDADAGAGTLALTGGGVAGVGVGVGVSLAANLVNNTTRASIDDSNVTDADNVTVEAQSQSTISAITGVGAGAVAAGGLAGVAFAGAAAGSGNVVSNKIEALITNESVITGTTGLVSVTALDNATIDADAGSGVLTFGAAAAIGAGVGFSASAALNDVSTETKAAVIDSTVTGGASLLVDATSTTDIDSIAYGIAGVLGLGGLAGVAVAGAGAGSVNYTNNKTEALIQDSNVSNVGSIQVLADDESSIFVSATGAAISISGGAIAVNVAIGFSAAQNEISNETSALIDNSSVSTSGTILVDAGSIADIEAFAIATSISVTGGLLTLNGTVVAAITLNTVDNVVKAEILDTGDNGGESATANGNIRVEATDDSIILAGTGVAMFELTAGGIAGSVSFGLSGSTNDIGNETRAEIDGSPVHSNTGTVSVVADSNADIDAVAVAAQMNITVGLLAAIDASVIGAVTLNTIHNITEAIIRDSGTGATEVSAPGDILVQATDDSFIDAVTLTSSLTISVGLVSGELTLVASASTNDVSNTTRALIENSSVDSAADISVLADSNAEITATAASLSLAGSVGAVSILVGVIGSVTLNTVTSTTEAIIRNSGNLVGEQIEATDLIEVDAEDSALVTSHAISGSINIGAGFAAVNLAVALNLSTNDIGTTTRAKIENSRVLSLTDRVLVEATSSSEINVLAAGMAVSVTAGGLTIDSTDVGAITLNTVSNTIEAIILNSDLDEGQGVTAPDAIQVTALDNSIIDSFSAAGSVSGGIALASIGLTTATALSTNDISNEVRAIVDNSRVVSSTENVAILAKSTSTITVSGVAAVVDVDFAPFSFDVAASGVLAKNITGSTIEARVIDGSEISGHATLAVDDGVSIQAIDISTIDASVLGVSVTLGLGSNVTLGVSATENIITNQVTATSAGSTLTAVTGNLRIHADATQNIHADSLAAGLDVSIGVGVTVVGAAALTEINSVVESSVNGGTLNASSGTVTVDAVSDLTADADAHGASIGFIGVSVAVMHPSAKIGGATRAWITGNTTTTTKVLDVIADSTSTADADTVSVGIGVIGVGGAGAGAISTVSRKTEAYLGTRAGSAPGDAVTIGATNAEVLVKAISDSDALVSATGGAFSLTTTIAAFLGEGTVSASTLAYVGEGLILNAGELDIQADATENADVDTVAIGAGFISTQGAKAIATISSTTEAFTGSRGGATPAADPTTAINLVAPAGNIDADGTLVIDALSSQTAFADASGGGGGAIQLAVMLPEATAGGAVRAYVGSGTDLSAASLTITANAPTMKADASGFALGISVLGGANGLQSKATVSGEVEAFIGSQAGSVQAAPAPDINVGSGAVTIEADARMEALSDVDGVGASFTASVSAIKPQSLVSGKTRAYVRDGVALNAGALSVVAGQIDQSGDPDDPAVNDRVQYISRATTFVAGFAALADLAFVQADSKITGTVEAFIGAPVGVSAGDAVAPQPLVNLIDINAVIQIEAASDMDVESKIDNVSVAGLFSFSQIEPVAEAGGTTRAFIGQGAKIDAPGIDIDADGDYDAQSTTMALGFNGGIDLNFIKATAKVTGLMDAHIGAPANELLGPNLASVNVGNGAIDIHAKGSMQATPHIIAGGLSGLADITDLDLTALVSGTVRSYIGEGVEIDAGTLTILADAPVMKAMAQTLEISIAGIASGSNITANAEVSGLVEAFIGAQADDDANGDDIVTDVDVNNHTVSVVADGVMEAIAQTDGGGFSGALDISLVKPTATVSGTARAYVRDGVNMDAGNLLVSAGDLAGDGLGDDQFVINANAESLVLNFAILGTGQGAKALADASGVVEAFLGAASGRVAGGPEAALLDINGPVTVTATSDINATADTDGFGASVGASVTVMEPTAIAGGFTRVYVGDGLDIRTTDLILIADGDAFAHATLVSVTVSGLGAGTGATPVATVSTVTEAYVGEHRDTTRDVGTNGLAVINIYDENGNPGDIQLDAKSTTQAQAGATAGSFAGLGSIVLLEPKAELSGATRAYVGPLTDLHAANVDATADEVAAKAIATTSGGSGSFGIDVTGITAKAAASRETEAFVGHDAQIDLGGASLTLTADTTMSEAMAQATVGGGSGAGLANIDVFEVAATVGVDGSQASATRAFIGDGAAILANNVSLFADSMTEAAATSDTFGIGGVANVTLSEVRATAAHDTEAFVGNNVTINISGVLTIDADNQLSKATPTIDQVGGSLGFELSELF
ncbi:MAG TPA: LEPR-XLL domain-containing protein, partial [Terriglobia bacterium]|nr:LEPR-XLL domain-containing protein [Terriglobia bacterium]